ncbi:MAG: tRNA-dihydrouridine synthase family protein [Firmicutes bacterium]|nr:tRNA-dihydrouridine synthase family protein [Bacillota bacterium]
MTKKINFDNAVVLAPLAGFTDAAQRQISSLQGADWCYTEMVSAKGLLYGNEKTADLLLTPPAQKITAVQLFGSEPDVFGEVLRSHEALAPFDIVDINMGCPVQKIVKSGEGSALSKDIKRAGEIVAACVKAAKGRIVTAKIRSGWDADSINAVEMAKTLEDNGVQAVTVHARTREQFYTGECDYALVSKVKQAVKIPVLVSGGIVDVESYERICKQTGCNAVMIGRGALGSNVFGEIKETLAPVQSHVKCSSHGIASSASPSRNDTTWNARAEFANHLKLMVEYYGEKYAVSNIRKFGPYYFRKVPNTKELRNNINLAKTTAEIFGLLQADISK